MDGRDSFAEVYGLLEAGDEDGAQSALDGIEEQSAERNYAQAQIYLKKKWYAEAGAQLSFAMEKDPGNEKYRKAAEELGAMAREGRKAREGHSAAREDAKSLAAECCCECSCELCVSGICEFFSG